jgi:predicted nucleic acid-binding Zn ribbon protein
MICKNCGFEIKENEKFCSKCGNRIYNNKTIKKYARIITVPLILSIIFYYICINLFSSHISVGLGLILGGGFYLPEYFPFTSIIELLPYLICIIITMIIHNLFIKKQLQNKHNLMFFNLVLNIIGYIVWCFINSIVEIIAAYFYFSGPMGMGLSMQLYEILRILSGIIVLIISYKKAYKYLENF